MVFDKVWIYCRGYNGLQGEVLSGWEEVWQGGGIVLDRVEI